jgi:hypothetical protein
MARALHSKHAVKQCPADIGNGDPEEHLPAAGAQHARGFFLFATLRLHQRDQFARDERQRDEDGCQNQTRYGEDDLDAMRIQPGPNQPCAPNNST